MATSPAIIPSLVNGILPWATLTGPATIDNPTGLDFATYTSGNTGMAITALPQTAYATKLADVPDGTNNALVRLTGNETVGSKTVFALLFAKNDVTLGGTDATTATLTVTSGLIGFGGTNDRLTMANLQLGTSNADSLLYVASPTATGTSSAQISSIITGSDQTSSRNMVKAGPGTVILNSNTGSQFTSNCSSTKALQVTNVAGLGSPNGGTTVNNGAQLQFNIAQATQTIIGGRITLNGMGPGNGTGTVIAHCW